MVLTPPPPAPFVQTGPPYPQDPRVGEGRGSGVASPLVLQESCPRPPISGLEGASPAAPATSLIYRVVHHPWPPVKVFDGAQLTMTAASPVVVEAVDSSAPLALNPVMKGCSGGQWGYHHPLPIPRQLVAMGECLPGARPARYF